MRNSRILGYSLRVVSLASDDQGDIPNGVHAVPRKGAPASLASAASHAAYLIERAVLPYNDRLPWVPHAVHEGRSIYRKWPYSVVFSTSPPLATHLAALRLKRRFGVKWIADLRDPLCGNPFRTRKIGNRYDGSGKSLTPACRLRPSPLSSTNWTNHCRRPGTSPGRCRFRPKVTIFAVCAE